MIFWLITLLICDRMTANYDLHSVSVEADGLLSKHIFNTQA